MPRLFPSNCLLCGKQFHPRRNPASYCCNAHRQKAYRDRNFTPHPAPVQDSRNHRRLAKPTKPVKRPTKRKPNTPPAARRKK